MDDHGWLIYQGKIERIATSLEQISELLEKAVRYYCSEKTYTDVKTMTDEEWEKLRHGS